MKILYIHQYFKTPDEPGGTRSYWFARELIKNGHEIIMLTSRNRQNKLLESENIDGINVLYIKNFYSNNLGMAARLFSFFRFMLYASFIVLQQKNIDLVFATSTPLSIAFPAMLCKYIKKTKFIFEVRDLWPEAPIQLGLIKNRLVKKILYSIEKKVYDFADHVITLSPGMYNGVLNNGIAEEKISMLPNMSKTDIFYKRPKNIELSEKLNINLVKFNVVYFGAIGKSNGLDFIIDAAKSMKISGISNIEFILAGSGSMEIHLKKRCINENIYNIKFIAPQPLITIAEIVNLCDCVLVTFANIPILATNSPNKFFDALSAAKPIIVNSNGWTKDLVEDNECGFFVDPEKPELLAEILSGMAEGKFDLMLLGENSRRLAETKFDKSIIAKEFLTLTEKIVKC